MKSGCDVVEGAKGPVVDLSHRLSGSGLKHDPLFDAISMMACRAESILECALWTLESSGHPQMIVGSLDAAAQEVKDIQVTLSVLCKKMSNCHE